MVESDVRVPQRQKHWITCEFASSSPEWRLCCPASCVIPWILPAAPCVCVQVCGIEPVPGGGGNGWLLVGWLVTDGCGVFPSFIATERMSSDVSFMGGGCAGNPDDVDIVVVVCVPENELWCVCKNGLCLRQCSLNGKLTPVASDETDAPLLAPTIPIDDVVRAADCALLIGNETPVEGANKPPDLKAWFADWFGLNNMRLPVEEAGSVFMFLKQASVWTWSDLALWWLTTDEFRMDVTAAEEGAAEPKEAAIEHDEETPFPAADDVLLGPLLDDMLNEHVVLPEPNCNIFAEELTWLFKELPSSEALVPTPAASCANGLPVISGGGVPRSSVPNPPLNLWPASMSLVVSYELSQSP